jgi:Tfp pilus assembly protein PilF
VTQRGGRRFHQVSLSDSQGRELIRQEQEVRFVIGSGTRTYSYLIDHQGYLLESPITWFSHARIWDLSPGFDQSYLAGRPVRQACLFCHCNQTEHVAGTDNGYRPPIFRGYAIGCERCHGPGELHVKRQQEDGGKGVDDTIVNPGRLEPILRESVCQQCHLEGSDRVLRRGTQPFDFRPGLPLHQFLSVFVPSPKLGVKPQFVGQVEQMFASRCFQASAGKLGCISCHDPHAVPEPAQRVSFFRSRCLNCHEEKGCSLPPAKRRQTEEEDSCIRCHMPRRGTHDLPHTITTDHRIPRVPQQAEAPPAPELNLRGMPLLHFHRDQDLRDDPGVSRDLGIALMDLAMASSAMAERAIALGVPLLEEAVQHWPNDARAWEAKGRLLWLAGRHREAFSDMEKALSQSPPAEDILEAAATMATALGKDETALAYCRRAVEINPWEALNHINLAEVWTRRREWSKVRSECAAALRINPFNVDARLLQVRYCLQAGDKKQARVEMDTVLALRPDRANELRRWFADQTR